MSEQENEMNAVLQKLRDYTFSANAWYDSFSNINKKHAFLTLVSVVFLLGVVMTSWLFKTSLALLAAGRYFYLASDTSNMS